MKTIDELLPNTEFKSAVVAYLIKDDKILLGLRKKVSFGIGENLVAGIGGKLEDGENDEDALLREIQEEIRVRVTDFTHHGRVRFLFPHKPNWQQDVAIYIVHAWEGEPVETLEIKPDWYDLDKIPLERMWLDNSYWMHHVLAGNKIDAVYLYSEDETIQEELIDVREA